MAVSRQYPAETITDIENADDLALLANTPAQVESLLLSLEQAARSIRLYVNSDEKKFMCFNQDGVISLNDMQKKLVD